MSVPARLAAFALAVAVAFGLGFGVGEAVGPFGSGNDDPHRMGQTEGR